MPAKENVVHSMGERHTQKKSNTTRRNFLKNLKDEKGGKMEDKAGETRRKRRKKTDLHNHNELDAEHL